MTDITENDLDEEDAGPQPRVTDAPIEIWLQRAIVRCAAEIGRTM